MKADEFARDWRALDEQRRRALRQRETFDVNAAGRALLAHPRGGRGVGKGLAPPAVTVVGPESVNLGEIVRLTGTSVNVASGGAYLASDTIAHQVGFAGVTAAGTDVTLPYDATYAVELEFEWDSYLFGGRVDVEIGGTVERTETDPGIGQRFSHVWLVDGDAGDVLKVKVTQSSGSAQAGSWTLSVAVIEPAKGAASGGETSIVSSDPIGWWTLGESSGTTAADSGPNGLDGTYQNSPTLGAAGLLSGDYAAATSVHFDPASDHRVVIPYNAAMNHDSFAVELWFRMDTLRDFNALAARTGGGTDSVATFDSYVLSTGEIRFYIRWAPGAPALYTFIDSAALSAGTTYHVVLNRDSVNDSTEIWVNGSLSGSETRAGTVDTTDHPLYLGRRHDAGTVELDGRMQYVAYYNRALTEAEIVEHYETGSGT